VIYTFMESISAFGWRLVKRFSSGPSHEHEHEHEPKQSDGTWDEDTNPSMRPLPSSSGE
jgi:hypothetical protein